MLEGRREIFHKAAPGSQVENNESAGDLKISTRGFLPPAEVNPNREIVVSLLRQLGWTRFLGLIPIEDPLKRDFYAEMCRVEKWNTRTTSGQPPAKRGDDGSKP